MDPCCVRSRPGSATLVVLMGLANRAAIANELLDAGWQAQTPAAVLIGVSHPGAGLARSLDGAADSSLEDEDDLPGIIVVGAVAALAGNHRVAGGASGRPLRTSASLG